MAEEIYRKLCETMAKRGGRYPGADIPEFYALVAELYKPEEAAVTVAMPRGFNPASAVASAMGKNEEEVTALLEIMADKGLMVCGDMDGTRFYSSPLFVPGIFEFQFMRGTKTDRDKRLAGLIHAYKTAYDGLYPPKPPSFPGTRVVTIDSAIKADNVVHTYDQMAHYIEISDPIAVSTCFCRHEAKLLDEKDDCGMPDDVCMMFGMNAEFVIGRKIGRRITKEEASEILKKAEEAGLVHAGVNRQDIDFICNCCPCHSMILRTALAYPKPGLFLNSGFKPTWDEDLCNGCETCIDRCPTKALTASGENVPVIDLDRCIGCGVCASGCPLDAISLEVRPEVMAPPVDQKALKEAMKAAQA